MSPTEFVAHVQAQGGEIAITPEADLAFRMPKGKMTPELRALWAELKWLVARDVVIAGWQKEADYQRYRAEHMHPAFCTGCGDEILAWPWDNPGDLLCLACARAQLQAEDDEDDPVIVQMLEIINRKHKGGRPPREDENDEEDDALRVRGGYGGAGRRV
jgi:hypothetical protein